MALPLCTARLRTVFTVGLASLILAGCQMTSEPRNSSVRGDPDGGSPSRARSTARDPAVRNNALALLNDLLGDEKNLHLLLLVKREDPALERLVKRIAKTAAAGAKTVESIAPKNSALLQRTDLPPGEVAARKAIAKTKKEQLLAAKDAEFEYRLLLTQLEALNYGTHLASVAAEHETQPRHARELRRLSTELSQLYDEVNSLLRDDPRFHRAGR